MTQDTSIAVRTPADLVAATPYVIGFHPTESLVVLGIVGGRIFFGARHDLPPPDGDDIVHLGAIIAAQRANSVALLAYAPPAAADPVVRRALQVFEAFRIPVAEAMRVHDGRWWSYFCGAATCCPAGGSPFDTATSVIAAEATYRGQVVLPNRQALVARVAPIEGAARRAMVDATARAGKAMHHLIADDRQGARAVRRAGRLAVREAEKRYRAGQCLSDDEVAWLGVSLIDPDVLEYTLERRGDHGWRLALWTDVLRRVEAPFVAPVGSVLGYLAWQAGEGALARVAVDRALHADPRHRMSSLLDEVLGLGIGPHALNALRESARAVPQPPGGPERDLRSAAARGQEPPPPDAAPGRPSSATPSVPPVCAGAGSPAVSASAPVPSPAADESGAPDPAAPAGAPERPGSKRGSDPSACSGASGTPTIDGRPDPAAAAGAPGPSDSVGVSGPLSCDSGPGTGRQPRRQGRFRRTLRRRTR